MHNCEICGRAEGSTKDRCGVEDGVPLGAVERCDLCEQLACPDCLHENDCCFVEADDLEDDPTWSPKGWIRTKAGDCNEWQRIAD